MKGQSKKNNKDKKTDIKTPIMTQPNEKKENEIDLSCYYMTSDLIYLREGYSRKNTLFTWEIPESAELDIRYEIYCKKNNIKHKTKILENKVKAVGKEALRPSYINTINHSYNLPEKELRFEGKYDYDAITCPNGILSGKWCFEVFLITNGFFRFGWGQEKCQFEINKESDKDKDIGYFFDSNIKMKLHKGLSMKYGELCGIGDVIGVCIDLDKGTIEFYLNGKSLGLAFESIINNKKEYYPKLLLIKDQIFKVNFGQTPFIYSYPYPSYDLPISTYGRLYNKTEDEIITILSYKTSMRDTDNHLMLYEITRACKFLGKFSFTDPYVFQSLIAPFLIQFIGFEEELQYILEICYDSYPHKEEECVNFIMDQITLLIEEHGLLGKKRIKEWKGMMEVFFMLIAIKSLTSQWSNAYKAIGLKHLKRVFNSNYFDFNEIYSFICKKYDPSNSKLTLWEVLQPKEKEDFNNTLDLENTYAEYLSKLINVFLTDESTVCNTYILRSFFLEFLKSNYQLGSNTLKNEKLYWQEVTLDTLVFTKNIYYNYLYLFTKLSLNKPFESIIIDLWFYPWFNNAPHEKMLSTICMGGSISNVSNEYFDKMKKDSIEEEYYKDHDFNRDFIHTMIEFFEDFSSITMIGYPFDYLMNKYKTTFISSSLDFYNILYIKDYLFSEFSQGLFYKVGFFFIKYFIWLKNTNVQMLSFLPLTLIKIPFMFYNILVQLNSKILVNKEERNKINQSSIYFIKDDYFHSNLKILFLLCSFTITNPETKDWIMSNMNIMIQSKQGILSILSNDDEMLEHLLNFIFNNINSDIYALSSVKLLLKVIVPIGFGKTKQDPSINHITPLMMETIAKYSISYLNTKVNVLSNYSKMLLKTISHFTTNLSEVIDKLTTDYSQLDQIRYVEQLEDLYTTYHEISDLLRGYEFFIYIIPEKLFAIQSMESLQLIYVLKIISSKIIYKSYFNNLLKVSEQIKSKLNKEKPLKAFNLVYAVIGIMIKIYEAKKFKKYDSFIGKLAESSDFDIKPFCMLHSQLVKQVKDKGMIEQLSKYKLLLNAFLKKKPLNKNTVNVDEKLFDDSKACIICYVNYMNVEVVPCKHMCCYECIKQYRTKRDKCFYCNTPIQDIKLIN